ncbi:CacyBP [Intoshia linei]|uniref:CacyBP n=1 Tax=Intoshia linei TaxID=1819745 RepID=A0A177AY94_9BILA|nr:CacyBP [Intoshia linei]
MLNYTTSQLQSALSELNYFRSNAQEGLAKKLLDSDISQIENRLKQIKSAAPAVTNGSSTHSLSLKTITAYGWDQSENYVKFYIDIENIIKIDDENITIEVSDNKVSVTIREFNNFNYKFHVGPLSGDVTRDGTYHRKRNNKLVLFIKKSSKQNFTPLLAADKSKEVNAVKPQEKSGDAGNDLMNMMKKMYDEGTPEMKRTIAEAWTKGQEKQSKENLH